MAAARSREIVTNFMLLFVLFSMVLRWRLDCELKTARTHLLLLPKGAETQGLGRVRICGEIVRCHQN